MNTRYPLNDRLVEITLHQTGTPDQFGGGAVAMWLVQTDRHWQDQTGP
jgi:hypothetical protein